LTVAATFSTQPLKVTFAGQFGMRGHDYCVVKVALHKELGAAEDVGGSSSGQIVDISTSVGRMP
jgi:hypothetical protein